MNKYEQRIKSPSVVLSDITCRCKCIITIFLDTMLYIVSDAKLSEQPLQNFQIERLIQGGFCLVWKSLGKSPTTRCTRLPDHKFNQRDSTGKQRNLSKVLPKFRVTHSQLLTVSYNVLEMCSSRSIGHRPS